MPMLPPDPNSAPQSDAPLLPRNGKVAFFLVTGLFFLWAIPNNLNDVLIRQFMKSFEISRLEAGLVQSAFYFGYFLLAIPAALVMRRFGYKTGLLTGLILYATGTFLFYPASMARSYPLFLFALFVIASGLGFLETGSNPLIAQLGDPATSVRRLNFSQAFNPLGSITGVLIGTVFIFSGKEPDAGDIARMKAQGTYDAFLDHETLRVLAPYLVLGVVVLVWAFLIFRTTFPKIEGDSAGASGRRSGGYLTLLRYPHFLSAVFAQFCYVGAQVGTWSYFIQYAEDYTHIHEKLGWLSAHHYAGGLRHRPILLKLRHEALSPRHDAWRLRDYQHSAGHDRNSAAGMGRARRRSAHQLLHVHHVPHDLCSRHQGPRRAHQGGRIAHRHGHHRRRSVHAADGARISGNEKHGGQHDCSARSAMSPSPSLPSLAPMPLPFPCAGNES